MTTDDEKISDELLALRLLAGLRIENGREITDYKLSRQEERDARAALARIVRREMRGFVGELLALAIDPNAPSSSPGMRPTRRVEFKAPKQGKPDTWARDLAVVDFVRRELRENPTRKRDAIYTDAAKWFRIDRSRIISIWTEHKQRLSSTGS